MLVVGSRGAGVFGPRPLGSVSAGLCRHALCPTAVIHQRDDAIEDTKLPVLVGIDGSPASEAATALAFDEASRRGVGLTALHAWSDVGVFPVLGMDWHTYRDEGAEVLGERLAGWQERYPDVTVQRRLVCDRPTHWLARRGRPGPARSCGQSRTRRLCRHAPRFGEHRCGRSGRGPGDCGTGRVTWNPRRVVGPTTRRPPQRFSTARSLRFDGSVPAIRRCRRAGDCPERRGTVSAFLHGAPHLCR